LDLKLANNQSADQGPKVSKLPLPVSDSPLVIDLPDGQKIVIGKMTQGSVIEVATWRGVGRPDSRTSRLMLGVGSGNVNEDKEEQGSSSQVPAKQKKPQDWRIVLYYLAVAIEFIKGLPWKKIALTLKSKIWFKRISKKSKIATSSVTMPVESSDSVQSVKISESKTSTAADDDIEAWLNRISEKASQKSATTKSVAKSAPKKASVAKKPVKKTAKPKAKRK
jgi:hypothetical protein